MEFKNFIANILLGLQLLRFAWTYSPAALQPFDVGTKPFFKIYDISGHVKVVLYILLLGSSINE